MRNFSNRIIASLIILMIASFTFIITTFSIFLESSCGSGSSRCTRDEAIFFKPVPQHRKNHHTTIFYNVYANPKNIALAKSIVKEQLSGLRPEHNNFVVRSIGYPIEVLGNNSDVTVVHHHDAEGDEPGTLDLLWKHCTNEVHSSNQVIYMHNKGSFHPSDANDKLRKFLTRGVLSEECENMPSTCNICSSRMSPLPHPHTSTPGNMWVAKCEYIKKLINPLKFEARMVEYAKFMNFKWVKDDGCQGSGRYAAEHWVHSHPSVNPCDLSTSDYVWNYDGLPENESEMMLLKPAPAPRYEQEAYVKKRVCGRVGVNPEQRLKEYSFLYNDTAVPSTWWGWGFFNVSSPAN